MDSTVIHHYYTPNSRVRAQLVSLYVKGELDMQINSNGNSPDLSKKLRKWSLFTDPLKISRAMIPSDVSAGSTKYFCPWMKVAH